MAADDIVVSKSSYDDFSAPCPWRNFEILAQNRPLDEDNESNFIVFSYVNPGWLSELSPFFANFCFDNPDRQAFIIDDMTYQDMLEFMRCICYCPMRKPLTVTNVSLVLRIATRFEMRPVMARCEVFVARTAKSLDRNKLFQVTCAVSQCDPNSTTMSVLVDRLASMKEEDLSAMHFNEMPGDVVADVYTQKMRSKERKSKRFCCIM